MGRPRLNRPLILEAPMRFNDGAGGFTQNWQQIGTLWAEVRARAGREVEGQSVTLARANFQIIVRSAPQGAPSRPVPGQRFRDNTRTFNILSVTEQDLGARYLTCWAEEEVVR